MTLKRSEIVATQQQSQRNQPQKERQHVRWLVTSPPVKKSQDSQRSCDFKRMKKRGLYRNFPPLTTKNLGGDEGGKKSG